MSNATRDGDAACRHPSQAGASAYCPAGKSRRRGTHMQTVASEARRRPQDTTAVSQVFPRLIPRPLTLLSDRNLLLLTKSGTYSLYTTCTAPFRSSPSRAGPPLSLLMSTSLGCITPRPPPSAPAEAATAASSGGSPTGPGIPAATVAHRRPEAPRSWLLCLGHRTVQPSRPRQRAPVSSSLGPPTGSSSPALPHPRRRAQTGRPSPRPSPVRLCTPRRLSAQRVPNSSPGPSSSRSRPAARSPRETLRASPARKRTTPWCRWPAAPRASR